MVGSQIVALSAVYERHHRDVTPFVLGDFPVGQCSVPPKITRAHKRGCRIPQTARRRVEERAPQAAASHERPAAQMDRSEGRCLRRHLLLEHRHQ